MDKRDQRASTNAATSTQAENANNANGADTEEADNENADNNVQTNEIVNDNDSENENDDSNRGRCWICLTCCEVNCGRDGKRHAVQHYKETEAEGEEKHAISMTLTEDNKVPCEFWCVVLFSLPLLTL